MTRSAVATVVVVKAGDGVMSNRPDMSFAPWARASARIQNVPAAGSQDSRAAGPLRRRVYRSPDGFAGPPGMLAPMNGRRRLVFLAPDRRGPRPARGFSGPALRPGLAGAAGRRGARLRSRRPSARAPETHRVSRVSGSRSRPRVGGSAGESAERLPRRRLPEGYPVRRAASRGSGSPPRGIDAIVFGGADQDDPREGARARPRHRAAGADDADSTTA